MTIIHMKHDSKPNLDFETINSIDKAKNASTESNISANMTYDSNIRENISTTMNPKLPQNIGVDIEPFLDVNENNKSTEKNTDISENYTTEPHTLITELISDSKVFYPNKNQIIMENNISESFVIVSRNNITGNKDDRNLPNRTEIHVKDRIIYPVTNMNADRSFKFNEYSMENVSNSMSIRNISGQE